MKLKNKKSVFKRYKITKNNIILHKHAFKGHLLINKSKKQKRRLSNLNSISLKNKKIIKFLLPYI